MPARLGDDVDDYCVKCKRLTNHVVVSLMGDEPAKVRCRTCHSDHDYRHEQAPPPKVDNRKSTLFKQVLGSGPVQGPDGAATAEDLTASALTSEPAMEIAAEQKPKARRKAQGQ